jgi:hypothetical protein
VRASAVIPARSAVLRGPTERAVLDLLTARLAAVSLSGYIFFGSSVKISDQARPARSHAAFNHRHSFATKACDMLCMALPACLDRLFPYRLFVMKFDNEGSGAGTGCGRACRAQCVGTPVKHLGNIP